MEENENNNTENQEIQENTVNEEIKEEKKHVCFENHCWKMCLGMVLAAFAGAFLAVYFVSDQIMERQFKKHVPPVPHHVRYERNPFEEMDRFDEIYEKNLRDFEQTFEHFKKFDTPSVHMPVTPNFATDSVKIKTDINDNEFKITIGLKPFQNDENRINYNINGRKLTVYGDSHINDNGYEEDVSFSQDFILPENADIMNIIKKKHGDKLVISVLLK